MALHEMMLDFGLWKAKEGRPCRRSIAVHLANRLLHIHS
jgi:hypothetical protein